MMKWLARKLARKLAALVAPVIVPMIAAEMRRELHRMAMDRVHFDERTDPGCLANADPARAKRAAAKYRAARAAIRAALPRSFMP